MKWGILAVGVNGAIGVGVRRPGLDRRVALLTRAAAPRLHPRQRMRHRPLRVPFRHQSPAQRFIEGCDADRVL